jgi:peptidoglycan hydrolase-like amidase
MGNGLGSFSTATNFSAGTAPISIVSADFNGDGKMDLVTANANSNNVSVLLNFIPIVTASVSGATITANQNEATYQWINCNGNVPISGETNQIFNATASGDYAVIVTQSNCSDTSECFNITTVGLIENNSSAATTIYPNPSKGRFTIIGNSITSIEVYNVIGENIFRSLSNNQKLDIDLSNQINGVYFMKIYEGQTYFTKKVILE